MCIRDSFQPGEIHPAGRKPGKNAGKNEAGRKAGGGKDVYKRQIYYDLSLLVEHEGYAAGRSNISVAFCERILYIGGRTVLIVCQSLHDDRRTVWPIAFICNMLVICRIGIAVGFLNISFNRIIRHVIGFRLRDYVTQPAVDVYKRQALFLPSLFSL